MKKIILFTMTVLFIFAIRAGAIEAPSNMELLRQIQELRDIVNEQSERISVLEMHHVDDAEKFKEYEEKINKIDQVLDKDVSERFKSQLKRLEETSMEGLSIGGGATFIGQGTPNANAAGSDGIGGTEDSRFDGSYSVDLEIAKEFGENGFAFIHLETGDGDTLEGDLSLYPRCGVNRDADRSGNVVSITEAWYNHEFFDDQVTVTGGKIDPTVYMDTNDFANDETTQFLGAMFRNSPAIEFPDNNFGGRIYLTSKEFPAFDVAAMYLEADGNWEQIFNHPFIGVQAAFMPEKMFDLAESMWRGKYRAYFWYNGSDHTDIRDALETKQRNYGFGISCDQNITDVFGIFQRFGWQNPEVSTVEYHWSAGGQMTGKYWGRQEDILAVAVGQAIPGAPYRDTFTDHNNETHIETYYSFKVFDHLTLSPDMQVIWDPNGSKEDNRIFVYGIRGQVDL